MTRLGILGYGNLGRGIEFAAAQNSDMELKAVFTRRDPKTLTINSKAQVYSAADLAAHKDEIDVLIMCGGSATDLPAQTPEAVKYFNVVDSFDTHARIPEHFKNVDEAAKKSGKIGFISVGWDPGMFSLARLYSNAILVDGADYTFWGRGVSQGHSDAIRRIEGVQDARQYTVPVPEAVAAVRNGVVAKEGADKARIEQEIKTMPNYFSDYDTTVHFISQEELDRDHKGLPHGGSVLRTGKTGAGNSNTHTIEYSLKLDSNPAFTSCVLVAFARAAHRMNLAGMSGAKTVFDVPPIMLLKDDPDFARAHLL